MPRGQVDEELWARAKAAVAPYADRYDEPYAVVMYVYQRMLAAKGDKPCGCAKCRRKSAKGKIKKKK